ncbi:MAG: MarR family transcriptional regulator [Actinocatenispora sp.]
MSGPSEPATAPDEDLKLADRLSDQFVRFVRLVGREHTRLPEVYQKGIEKAGYVVLWHLVTDGPRRATTLAEALHSDISTISRQVTALVSEGWITRTPDPEDGRAYLLAATDAGRQIFQRIRERRNAHMARVLAGWPDAERDQLLRTLEKFNNDFEDYLQRAHDQRGDTPQQEEMGA